LFKTIQTTDLRHDPGLQGVEGDHPDHQRISRRNFHRNDRKWNLHLLILRSMPSIQVNGVNVIQPLIRRIKHYKKPKGFAGIILYKFCL